jgi:hypothetical protein
MAILPLSRIQKEKLDRLQPVLKKAAQKGDIQVAKEIVFDLKDILTNSGRQTKLLELKCYLFEAYMESGDLDFAITGFIGIRQKLNKNTRTNLEATSLLAICYLRKSDIDSAEPLIKEVLQNDKVIKSEFRRVEFRKKIIERFDEEGTLFAIKDSGYDDLDPEEIQREAGFVLQRLNEDEIFIKIGENVPSNAIGILFRVDDFSKKQLSTAERKRLSSPKEALNNEKVGKTLFSSVKRTMYKSICDPESDIYKTWFNDGLKLVLNKNYLGIAVTSVFLGLGIGIKSLAIYIAALILKFGIEVYCDKYRPEGIMEMR